MDWCEHYQDYWKHLPFHLASYIRNDAHLLAAILALEPESILEVGAGSGRGSLILQMLLPDTLVVASDIDPRVCEGIQQLAAQTSLKVVCCNATSIPYREKTFDVVFSSGLLEHLSEEEVIEVVKEQLRVGKIVFVEVPTVHWLLARKSTHGDERFFLKGTWIMELARLGYIMDVTFSGTTTGQEEVMMVALTDDPDFKYPVALGIRIPLYVYLIPDQVKKE